jgi:hypothetical protein
MSCCFSGEDYQRCDKYVVKSRQIVRCLRKGTHGIIVDGSEPKRLCDFHYELYLKRVASRKDFCNNEMDVQKDKSKRIRRYSRNFLQHSSNKMDGHGSCSLDHTTFLRPSIDMDNSKNHETDLRPLSDSSSSSYSDHADTPSSDTPSSDSALQ